MADDPFAILGLPRRFDLASATVERAYLTLAAQAHPDLMSDAIEAETRSSMLNRARATLVDPERRAVALWELWSAEFGVSRPERADALPPAFLMEMMEVREELENARGDAAAIERWSAWAEAKRDEYRKEVGQLLGGLTRDMPRADASRSLAKIKQVLNQWRYVERMVEQME